MGKPSMFSQSYEDSMRKRRRNIVFVIIALLIVIGAGIFVFTRVTSVSEIRNKVVSFAKSLKEDESKDIAKNDESKNKNTEKIESTDAEKEVQEKPEETIEDASELKEENKGPVEKKEYIGLGQEVMVTLNCLEDNGVKKVVAVEPSDKYSFDLFNDKIVVNVIESQNTYLIKSDLSVTNITYPEYVSTSKKIFTKDSVRAKRDWYVWARGPKFIDDENIMYVTSLPWINNDKNEFIWMYNIKENKYVRFGQNEYSKFKNIILGNRNADKLEAKIDGKDYLVDKTGKIIPR